MYTKRFRNFGFNWIPARNFRLERSNTKVRRYSSPVAVKSLIDIYFPIGTKDPNPAYKIFREKGYPCLRVCV